MLRITWLSASVQDKAILHDVSMDIHMWKNYCILGKNGSWKSSLAKVIMWHPSYEVTSGSIELDGEDVLEMEPNERAEKWIFLAFQSIPEIKWIKVFEFLRSIYAAKVKEVVTFIKFKKIILPLMQDIHMDKEFLWRDLNVGFSWGERRKLEVLQIKLLQPTYILLDEIDSWLDVDAFRMVAWLLKDIINAETSLIIITHLFTILEHIPVDTVHVFAWGKIKQSWWAELAQTIQKDWFWEEILTS